jgi:hypothetical protein
LEVAVVQPFETLDDDEQYIQPSEPCGEDAAVAVEEGEVLALFAPEIEVGDEQ